MLLSELDYPQPPRVNNNRKVSKLQEGHIYLLRALWLVRRLSKSVDKASWLVLRVLWSATRLARDVESASCVSDNVVWLVCSASWSESRLLREEERSPWFDDNVVWSETNVSRLSVRAW